MTMKKGPSPAIVSPSLIGSGTALIISGPPLISAGTILGGIGSAMAAVGGLITSSLGAGSVPIATLASPFFTTFLDLFSGLSRGFWDASLGNDLFPRFSAQSHAIPARAAEPRRQRP